MGFLVYLKEMFVNLEFYDPIAKNRAYESCTRVLFDISQLYGVSLFANKIIFNVNSISWC